MKKNKTLKVLTTSALLASLAAPFAAPAYAAGDITALSAPTVTDSSDNPNTTTVEGVALGTIKLNIPAGSLKEGDVATISLPVDTIDFDTTVQTQAKASTDTTSKNYVMVPQYVKGTDENAAYGKIEVEKIDADEIKLKVVGQPKATEDAVVYLYLGNMLTDDESDGPLDAQVSAPSTSGFPTGSVTIGNVNSDGLVKMAISSKDNSNDRFDFNLRLTETIAGSLKDNTDSLKFKLPSGFRWAPGNGTYTITKGSKLVPWDDSKAVKTIYGQDISAKVEIDDEELKVIDLVDGSTSVASSWEIPVGFIVDDESKVKTGDVKVSISGKTNTEVSEAVVGTYGEYGSSVKAVSTPSIIAGQDDQEIGDIHITENIEGSLVEGRTVQLTLPEGARWQEEYLADLEDETSDSFDGTIKTNEGLKLDFVGYTSTDRRTAKFTVSKASSDNATVKFEDVKVAVQPGFSGDLEVEVSGSAGVEGKVTVAKVEGVIKASAENAPSVVIGMDQQKAADLVLEEGIAGAFANDDDADKVVLDLPDGVTFTKTPKIEVTDGDVKITNVKRIANDNQVEFTIDSESTKPSKIKVSDISLKVDRTVPQGDIVVKVKGTSVAKTAAYSDWENNTTAASAAIAKVATPAPTDTTASNIVFKLNSKTYTVDGKSMEMDAAPLVGWDRAYLPVRFAANALNVSDENIIWDDKTNTFTVFKGDRVITGKVGDKFLTVNGVKVPMDVPVWRNKVQTNDRVMVPIRYLANALNANIEWNKETSEITIEAKK